MLIFSPKARGSVRASQLNEVHLQVFRFTPSLLNGFLTVSERHAFETEVSGKIEEVRFLPSTHPETQWFSVMKNDDAITGSMGQRAEALLIVAAAFQEQLARNGSPVRQPSSADRRFDEIIAQMPDAEMINRSPEELARLCSYSPRHFNRLFRQHFGTSPRAWQNEMRLLKAMELLGSSNDRITNIAYNALPPHLI